MTSTVTIDDANWVPISLSGGGCYVECTAPSTGFLWCYNDVIPIDPKHPSYTHALNEQNDGLNIQGIKDLTLFVIGFPGQLPITITFTEF